MMYYDPFQSSPSACDNRRWIIYRLGATAGVVRLKLAIGLHGGMLESVTAEVNL